MLSKIEYENLFKAVRNWRKGIEAFQEYTGIEIEEGRLSNPYTEAFALLTADYYYQAEEDNRPRENMLFEIVYEILCNDYYSDTWEKYYTLDNWICYSVYLTFDDLYETYCDFINSNCAFSDEFIQKHADVRKK